jgi:hypothetical protein
LTSALRRSLPFVMPFIGNMAAISSVMLISLHRPAKL